MRVFFKKQLNLHASGKQFLTFAVHIMYKVANLIVWADNTLWIRNFGTQNTKDVLV